VTVFFAGSGCGDRDVYIGRIEVEQVEQQAFLSRDCGFLADSRAPLQWSKWSASPVVSPVFSRQLPRASARRPDEERQATFKVMAKRCAIRDGPKSHRLRQRGRNRGSKVECPSVPLSLPAFC
jgi:hypothetical protein